MHGLAGGACAAWHSQHGALRCKLWKQTASLAYASRQQTTCLPIQTSTTHRGQRGSLLRHRHAAALGFQGRSPLSRGARGLGLIHHRGLHRVIENENS